MLDFRDTGMAGKHRLLEIIYQLSLPLCDWETQDVDQGPGGCFGCQSGVCLAGWNRDIRFHNHNPQS